MDKRSQVINKISSRYNSLASSIQLVEEPIQEYIGTEESAVYLVIPPDGGWGWVVVTAAFISFLVSDGILYSVGIYISDMSEDFHCSKSKIVLIGAITSSCFSLTGPFTAALINKFGYKQIAILGSFIAGISCFLTAQSSSLDLIYLTAGVLGGTGLGMIHLPAVIAVGFYFEKWRALATSIAMCGGGVGGFALPLMFGLIIDEYGWRHTYQLVGIISLLNLLCGLSFKPLKPTKVHSDIEMDNNLPVIMEESTGFSSRSHNLVHRTIYQILSNTQTNVAKQSHVPNVQSNNTTSTMITIMNKKFDEDNISEFIVQDTSYDSTATNGNSTFSAREQFKNKTKCNCSSITRCLSKIKKKREQTTNDHPAETISRPLYRDDIFYGASLLFLPEYQKYTSQLRPPSTSADSKSISTIKYSMAVTRAVTQRELAELKGYVLCSEAMKRTLATMLDFKLLKSPSFALLTISSIFTSFGFFTPYMFIQDRSVQNGIPKKIAFWFVPCIGVANTIGRITCGITASFPGISTIKMMYINLFLGGLATLISEVSYDIWAQFLYAAIYGFALACTCVLRSIVIVDIIGLEKLTNAIGISMMLQGLASLIGTIIAGLLRDKTGNYQMSFYFAGGCFLIGSLLLVPIKRVSEWEKLQSN